MTKRTLDECVDMMASSAISMGPVSRRLRNALLDSCVDDDCGEGCPDHFPCTENTPCAESTQPARHWWQFLFRPKGQNPLQS
jgi:hypothetical protein